MGNNLVENSEAVARVIFQSVIVRDKVTGPDDQTIDATLVPRLVFVERTFGRWAWSDVTATIQVEWTLKDEEGAIVWIETIAGDATGPNGNTFTFISKTEELFWAAITDLFRKSYEVLSTSTEIRDFAHSI